MDTGIPTLTVRQAECLKGKWQRKLDKEIAYELGISQRAVEEHLRAAREKIGVSSTRAAVEIAASRYGWEGSVEPNRGPSDLPEATPILPIIPPAEQAPGPDNVVRDGGAVLESGIPDLRYGPPVPFALRGGSRNGMDLTARLLWPLAIAVLVPAILVLTLMTSDYAGRLVDNIIRLFG